MVTQPQLDVAAPESYVTLLGDLASFMSRGDATARLAPPRASADWLDWSNHASALYVLGATDHALLAAVRAVELRRTPTTLLNLGVILETQSKFDEALSLAAEAYRLDPVDPYVACWYSDALLRAGRDWSTMWPIYTQSHADWSFLSAAITEWNGRSSLTGRRLLVLSAGGYGDNILFLRWMPRLRDLGAHVTYMCPADFVSLAAPFCDRTLPGSVSGLDGTLVPADYDLFACVLALGRFFCPSPMAIPPASYIASPPTASGPRPLRIGICTRAGEEKFPRRHRTLSNDQCARLISAIPLAASIVNLNFGPANVDLSTWADTARTVASCDLIVTVDTGVAHLAGAMGKWTWVMLPGLSAAYYGVDSVHSPFYPSQHLFRNGGEGIDYAVDLVAESLRGLR